ncbi:hypothetical protein FA95DRAFT_1463766, partial [Auriscalpium vulgare]
SRALTGFSIPGCVDKLIINLFADDTLLFLSKTDRYRDVMEILSKWCAASGAKFNIAKTEIIPIGTKAHRDNVVNTRKLSPSDRRIRSDTVIATDGQSSRYLGTWVGNGVDNLIPWGPVLDKVSARLKLWKQSYPSINARAAVVQMFAGGCTQFLTQAQGMPPPIEKALIKLIRDFVWSEDAKRVPIDLTHLYRPRAEGGIALLDIHARNDAIELMWLKRYLDLSDSRPTWAYATDVLIRKTLPDVHSIARLNTFLQRWSPPLRGRKGSTRLPIYLSRMLTVAKTHHTDFTALKLTGSLKRQLPAWFH